MPNRKRILPVVALALGLVVAMTGMAVAGPNAAATMTAKLNTATVAVGGAVTVTISATGLSGCTGYTISAYYDTSTVQNPTGASLMAGATGLSAQAADNAEITGFNRKSQYGAAMLGTPAVSGASDVGTLTFVAKTAGPFKIGIREVIYNAGPARDTIKATASAGSTILVFQINPPQPKVSIAPKSASKNFNQTQVMTAVYTGSAGDTITWTATATTAGGNIQIRDIASGAGVAIAPQPTLPANLSATAVTFKTSTTAGGSTITLGASGTGKMTATIVVAATSAGVTTRDTAGVVFDVPVPAELSAFAGAFADGKVQLNWTTVSQTNNAGWRVLRSTDNVNFEPISGIVSGAGTSNEQQVYGYADVNLPTGVEKVYYILEQVDLDGKVTRSRVAEVLLGGRFTDMPKEFSTAVYPNPFNPATTIAYNLPEAARVSIVIYDAIGQQVRTLVGNVDAAAGRYTAQWDAKDDAGRQVASGVYFAHITAGKFTGKQKMLLLK